MNEHKVKINHFKKLPLWISLALEAFPDDNKTTGKSLGTLVCEVTTLPIELLMNVSSIWEYTN